MNSKFNKPTYAYDFNDGKLDVSHFKKGHSIEVVQAISNIKKEPLWMLEARLNAYKKFLKMKLPTWGPDLSLVKFDELLYYVNPTNIKPRTWDEIPEKIRTTFDRLGIRKDEQNWLIGTASQYDSEMIFISSQEELNKLGVIFCSTEDALKNHPALFQKYFSTLVGINNNALATLNTAFWSGGTFVYIPKNVKLDRPLQSYFRINAREAGQFERTLIIIEEGGELHYIEGCTAPTYTTNNLHAAVVEIFVGKNAKCKYTTIQNWSDNVINLVTKSSIVDQGGIMEWVDGNLGSKINMKYPSTILRGDNSKGSCISIAIAIGKEIIQDAGAKMIHIGRNTSSKIISKSISGGGGVVNYRGIINIYPDAKYSRSKVECDTMILDEKSKSDTIPTNIITNSSSSVEHEAVVSKISEREIYYLQTKGLSELEAKEMIIMGFIEPFAKEIPLEFATELNKLVKMEIESSIG